MNQIKEVLRLRYEVGCSQEAIANSTGMPRSTVRDYLARAKKAGIGWPIAQEMNSEDVHGRLCVAGHDVELGGESPLWAELQRSTSLDKAITAR